jgi:hypothetical protein
MLRGEKLPRYIPESLQKQLGIAFPSNFQAEKNDRSHPQRARRDFIRGPYRF